MPNTPTQRANAPYINSASHDCAIQRVPAAVNEYGSRRGIPWSRINPPVRRCQRKELSPSGPDASPNPPTPQRSVTRPAIVGAENRRAEPLGRARGSFGGRAPVRSATSMDMIMASAPASVTLEDLEDADRGREQDDDEDRRED